MQLPRIIQGGMGIGVSGWELARAVSTAGELGVVSGTGLDTLLVRKLQDGDLGGHIRRALEAFPFQESARNILSTYFRPSGRTDDEPYRHLPTPTLVPSRERDELTVAANFVEVFLAKEHHLGKVGINFLQKIEIPTLSSIYGALLAKVDYIFMGAGIPVQIPAALSSLLEHLPTRLEVTVENSSDDSVLFDPASLYGSELPELSRPRFFPIVSSNILASVMAKKASGPIDGLIIEDPSAGGHNAPPRGMMRFDELGEPIYGPKDVVNLERIRDLGLPFYLAGGRCTHDAYHSALEEGAAGVQVGSAFAICRESGFTSGLKEAIIRLIRTGEAVVRTDTKASPTGFPFKVMDLPGTLSDLELYAQRTKSCALGYLRQIFRREDDSIGYRCPAENQDIYRQKGGSSDTEQKQCLCSTLFASIGLGDTVKKRTEKAIITLGSRLEGLRELIEGTHDLHAADVIRNILG